MHARGLARRGRATGGRKVWQDHRRRLERHCVTDSKTVRRDAAAGDDLLYEVRGGIGRVTFNRPQARNALTFAMYERLKEIWDAPDYESQIDRILSALERCRVPTIAAIAGACTGGGAAIAACCDLRIATRTARFGFPIARTLGNCLSMSSLGRLAALIGPARVKDLIFTARLLDADEAFKFGLLNEVVEDSPALERRTGELGRLIAGNAPLTLRSTKEALRRLQERLSREQGEDLILMCYMSRDFREGMDAFLSKRPPKWSGE